MDALWNEGKINLDVIEKWGEEQCVHQQMKRIVLDTNCLLMCIPKSSN